MFGSISFFSNSYACLAPFPGYFQFLCMFGSTLSISLHPGETPPGHFWLEATHYSCPLPQTIQWIEKIGILQFSLIPGNIQNVNIFSSKCYLKVTKNGIMFPINEEVCEQIFNQPYACLLKQIALRFFDKVYEGEIEVYSNITESPPTK